MPAEPKDPGDSRALYRAPIGTHDVLPPESHRWAALVAAFAQRASRFGFDLVITPIFEHLEVFQRVGESTDVVRKEMYEFEDKGGRRIALRPEGTAPVVRSFVQHRPPVPWKVWYVAPHFRYERPQKGRYRQHWQVGAEVLGVDDADVDVEVIALAHGFYRELGLTRQTLMLNSMGDDASRTRYLEVLRGTTGSTEPASAPTSRNGSSRTRCACSTPSATTGSTSWNAPQLGEYLSDESAAHFEQVQQRLDSLGIEYEIAPRLVRGFDYYTGTTFEFQSDALDAAQNAIGGGGRYDKLAAEMGGPPTPGMGFGIGIERVLIACDAEQVFTDVGPRVDAFVVNGLGAEGGGPVTMLVAELREQGMRAERAYGDRSVKAQWKLADRSGAAYGVMLGRAELERAAVAVKDLRSGEQEEISRTAVAAWLQSRRTTDPEATR